jgi:hypothetical protein
MKGYMLGIREGKVGEPEIVVVGERGGLPVFVVLIPEHSSAVGFIPQSNTVVIEVDKRYCLEVVIEDPVDSLVEVKVLPSCPPLPD